MTPGRRRYGACICCGRLLTDPVSIERGIGPVCAATAKERAFMEANLSLFPEANAQFTVAIEHGVVVIRDLDQGGKSVTNDIERVIDDAAERLGNLRGKLVVYLDSAGDWDGVRLTDDGRYAGFVALRQRDVREAALAMREWARRQ